MKKNEAYLKFIEQYNHENGYELMIVEAEEFSSGNEPFIENGVLVGYYVVDRFFANGICYEDPEDWLQNLSSKLQKEAIFRLRDWQRTSHGIVINGNSYASDETEKSEYLNLLDSFRSSFLELDETQDFFKF